MSKSEDKILNLLNRLWAHFEVRRKLHFVLLLVLMVFTAFAEVFSLSAVFPFLAVMTDPKSVFENTTIQP